ARVNEVNGLRTVPAPHEENDKGPVFALALAQERNLEFPSDSRSNGGLLQSTYRTPPVNNPS
ncbi:MAG TPA: hypothetical protein PLS55_01520, partial [Thermogutta sp.]|nr:hypothetical protein [Thermogutta sp.]